MIDLSFLFERRGGQCHCLFFSMQHHDADDGFNHAGVAQTRFGDGAILCLKSYRSHYRTVFVDYKQFIKLCRSFPANVSDFEEIV